MTTTRSIAVRDLLPDMLLDLEHDLVANGQCSAEQLTGEPCPDRDHDGHMVTWKYEYGRVYELVQETPECIRVDFDNGSSIGFPLDHQVTVVDVDEDDDVDG